MSRQRIRIEDTPAYMQGFVSGRKATGLDWAQLRLAVEEAHKEHLAICEQYERRIRELEMLNADLEHEIIRRDSEIEALKVAWRHRGEG